MRRSPTGASSGTTTFLRSAMSMHATSPALVSCPSNSVIVIGAGALVDVHVIEDVAGLDAAPEEDRDARSVIVHEDVVEDVGSHVRHPGGRLDELGTLIGVRDHRRLVAGTRGVAHRGIRTGADDLLAALVGVDDDRIVDRVVAVRVRRRTARPVRCDADPCHVVEAAAGSRFGSVERGSRGTGADALGAQDAGDHERGDREEQGEPGTGRHRHQILRGVGAGGRPARPAERGLDAEPPCGVPVTDA